ncbi:hypothetical protein SAMN02745225_01128 [Ferrithrix thermotolerans DSM 19514]|uniref:Uncharacterized protein n=1 Tax=Ferrithrix thermotolerans DSM 19514 TaxID=1121881 RepID=A0A1M4UWV2_9ACTN|nr:hypothetical protein [Ferrithrix thermotolerans]SHE61221.1 hypothetical protein SAMN02745225_01128 [Ferrithrix thermotolerans DSM 19514]
MMLSMSINDISTDFSHVEGLFHHPIRKILRHTDTDVISASIKIAHPIRLITSHPVAQLAVLIGLLASLLLLRLHLDLKEVLLEVHGLCRDFGFKWGI